MKLWMSLARCLLFRFTDSGALAKTEIKAGWKMYTWSRQIERAHSRLFGQTDDKRGKALTFFSHRNVSPGGREASGGFGRQRETSQSSPAGGVWLHTVCTPSSGHSMGWSVTDTGARYVYGEDPERQKRILATWLEIPSQTFASLQSTSFQHAEGTYSLPGLWSTSAMFWTPFSCSSFL